MSDIVISPGAILAEAERQTRDGLYSQAIDTLQTARSEPNNDHPKYWEGMVCVMTARSKLHMQEDCAAALLVEAVPHDLRASNPKIEAECRAITGILRRREAYRTWKITGQSFSPLAKTREAITEFTLAKNAAGLALEERLQHNCELNVLYSHGLVLAMENAGKDQFMPIVVSAIIAEASSRECMPSNARDYLTGLTIVADLALGAGVALDGIFNLSTEWKYHWACRILFGSERTWQEYILNQVSSSPSTKPDVSAKALLLGSKILLSEQEPDERLLQGYASLLRYCSLHLTRRGSNQQTRDVIEETISKYPEHIARRVRRANFLG